MSTLLVSVLLGVPAAGTLFCAAVRRRRSFEIVTLVSAGLTFAVSCLAASIIAGGGRISTPMGWFFLDALSSYFLVIAAGSTLVVAVCSVGYLHRQIRKRNVDASMLRLYYLLLNAFLATMMLVLVSNNLGFLWIGAEATTLATAFLVAYYEREGSVEAAWKYVVICSVGLALALFGIILTYFSALHAAASQANALNWTTLLAVAGQLDPAILKLAFVFILIGFGTKAGLVPMHTWKPDAYSEAPAPISALMAGGLVNVALYALIRFYILVHKAIPGNFSSTLFMIFGLVSMGVAVPFILLQRDFKRLLAYSSVEHVGIIVFAFGLGTRLAYVGALLHLLNNTLAKLVLFLTAGNIRLAYDSKIMRRVTGAIKVVPVSAALFLLAVFAVCGWPPFGLFVSELTIVTAGFAGGNVFASVLFLGVVATVFVGFIYYATGMVFGEPARPIEREEGSVLSLVVIGALVVFLAVLGTVIPPFLYGFLERAAEVVRG